LEQDFSDLELPDDDDLVIGADEDDEEEDEGETGRAPIELDDAVLDPAALAALFARPRGTRPRANRQQAAAPAAPRAPAPTEPAPTPAEPSPNVIVLDAEPTSEPVLDAAREAELKQEIETHKNNHLRAVADLHNYRRRTEEEMRKLKASAAERLIKEILPIVDDFDRSLAAAKQSESYEQLVTGVEAVLRKFVDTLHHEGVDPIPALGEVFNPLIHEAIMVEEGTDAPDDTVVEELRKGYMLNGQLLRPSLVKVAKS